MTHTRSTVLAAVAAACLLVAPTAASAQETQGGGGRSNFAFGLGAQAMLAGPAGAAATFDIGLVHIDTILYFLDADSAFGDSDSLGFGARGFFSLHQTQSSDFGIGGGLGFILDDNPGDDDSVINLELGGKMRAFIVPNVALTAFVGLAVVVDTEEADGDDDGVIFGGQQVGLSTLGLTSGFGFTYYFN